MDNYIKENLGVIAGLAFMFMLGFFSGQEYLKFQMKTALTEISDSMGDAFEALSEFDATEYE